MVVAQAEVPALEPSVSRDTTEMKDSNDVKTFAEVWQAKIKLCDCLRALPHDAELPVTDYASLPMATLLAFASKRAR